MRLWGPLVLLVLAALVAINVALYMGGLTQVATYFSAPSTPVTSGTPLQLPPVHTEPLASPPPPAPVAADSCGVQANTELAGRVVRWGADHLTDDAGTCCRACSAHSECNVWVFCPPGSTLCTPRQCWLKHQALFAGLPAGVMSTGAATPWTSGQLARFLETAAPDAAALGITMKALDPATAVAAPPPRKRECGSPALDAYASVKPACLEASATAQQFNHSEAARMAQTVWFEEHASYDGLAVAWGVGNKKANAAACADACRRHVADPRLGMFGKLPCNAFVYCPVGEARCFEPDAHMHTGGDCWLKFTEVPEAPEVNARGAMVDPATFKNGVAYNDRHPAANKPLVPWTSGVLLPPVTRGVDDDQLCGGSKLEGRQAVCCEQLNQVLPGLFIASGQAAAQWSQLAACGVTHVVNAAPSVELCWHKPQLDYLVVDVLDGPDEPIRAHFGRVNAYVTAARRAGGTVLVHCHGGVSRAAALVLAYLIGEEGLSYSTAWERLRTARPVVAPNSGFVQQLRAFEKQTQCAQCTDALSVAHVASAEVPSCAEEGDGADDLFVAAPPRVSFSDAPRSASSVLSMGPDTPDAYEEDRLAGAGTADDTEVDEHCGWHQQDHLLPPRASPGGTSRRASLPPHMPTSGVRPGPAVMTSAGDTADGFIPRRQSL